MTGSQKKFEMPTQAVTNRLSVAESFKTDFPKVGV
jgi:hypothetical protein